MKGYAGLKKGLLSAFILIFGMFLLPGYSPVRAAMPGRGSTKGVPEAYYAASAKRGHIEDFYYTSKDYAGDGSSVSKKAVVYLPYGYDPGDTTKRYNIVYFMHGLGETADSLFSYAGGRAGNLLDNMIEKGEIPPLIVVAPTFDTENKPRDMQRSDSEVRQFHREFLNDLMPSVEGKYHTYAGETTKSGLAASRDHRAFAGFSLGAVTTWFEFCYNYDYIRYFLPMSCSCWYYGGYGNYLPGENTDFLEKLVNDNNLTARGYYIYSCTGTGDVEQGQVNLLMDEMQKRSTFSSADNLVYYKKEGGIHDYSAGLEYMYNALPLFFTDITVEDAVYYNLYSKFERFSDPSKEDAGIYFFKGNPGGGFTICVEGAAEGEDFEKSPGFIHAWELSGTGNNAFVLKYRSGEKAACEDLSRAIALIHENTEVMDVSVKDYALWGGNTGKKIISEVNRKGTAAFGTGSYPRSTSVIIP